VAQLTYCSKRRLKITDVDHTYSESYKYSHHILTSSLILSFNLSPILASGFLLSGFYDIRKVRFLSLPFVLHALPEVKSVSKLRIITP
jgi:hypothetical protein